MSSTLAIYTLPSSAVGENTLTLPSRSSSLPPPPPPPPLSNYPPSPPLSDTNTSTTTTTNSTVPATTGLMPRKRQAHRRTHPGRRRDCYQLLQEIIQENKRLEREEHEAMIRQVPLVIAWRSPSQDLPSILVKTPPHSPITPQYPKPPPPPPRQSVRFAADPPKVFNCSSGTSAIAKLRSFLHLFSD